MRQCKNGILILLLFNLNMSYGQYKSPVGSGNIGLAGQTGINFMEGAQFLDVKPGLSLAGGLSFKYYQTITVGFQLDLLFLKTMGKYSRIESLASGNTKVNYSQGINYLSIPLSTNFYLSDRHESEVVYLTLGVTPSFLLSAKLENDLQETGKTKESNASDFNKMDFALVTGVGLEFRRLDLHLQYSLGLIDVNATENGSKITNHGPNIRITYFLKRWD